MVDIKSTDLEVLWVEPQNDADARVPTAQELAASSHLHQQNLERASRLERPAGLLNRPTFTSSAKSVVLPAGLAAYAPGHPSLGAIASNTTVNIPALSDTVSTISRYDYIYLAVMGVVFTADLDPDIALDFQWKNQANALQILSKENTRRIRTVWAVVHSVGTATASAVYSAIPSVSGVKTLTAAKSAAGGSVGAYRIYALDPQFTDGAQYEVIEDTLELVDLLRVWRVQNFNQSGYVWGRTGEANFEADYHLQPTYRYVGEGWDDWGARLAESARRIVLGRSLRNSPTYDRAVQNFLNGQVGTNLDAPGLATASPNGSTAVANDQRITFTNEPFLQKYYAVQVTTADAGGLAQASVPFQVSSPLGAAFSPVASDHKVYAVATGQEVTNFGILTGLGGTGALVWTANNTNVIAVGDLVRVQAAIQYPAGSGFAVEGEIEKVFKDNTQLNTSNVREGSNDISAYTVPASSESFIAVLGKERAALHYIYKKVSASTDSNGVLFPPGAESGAIAFINGVSGRVDAPVKTGLNPSTSYDMLVYYAPKSSESWQFQFKTPRYKGSGERSWVDGSKIASPPIAFAHTQGGGNSVFLADGEFQYEAIAFRLPANSSNSAIKHHLLTYRVQFKAENEAGVTSFRECPVLGSASYVAPKAGQTITVVNGVDSQSKGIAARLTTNGITLGVRKLPILCNQYYQLAVFLLLEKTGDRRVLVATLNGGDTANPSAIALDTDGSHYAGMDTFTLW